MEKTGNLPLLIKYSTLLQYIGAGLIIISLILFVITLPPSYIDFLLFLLLIFLGDTLFFWGRSVKSIFFLLKKEDILFKKYKFLKNGILYQYKEREFEMIPFSGYTPNYYIKSFGYGWKTPEPHIEIWTKVNSTEYIEDPYKKILRIIHKPRKYIQEDLKEYGKNVSDLLFLGFTKRGKDKYLLAMLEWDTKPYVIAKVLDIMIEIVEKYEEK